MMETGKSGMVKRLLCVVLGVICMATVCGSPSNIREEIQKYEWTDLYLHERSYEETCDILFWCLPIRFLRETDFTTSLEVEIRNKQDGNSISLDYVGLALSGCYIPAYGGIYQHGIPIKNRQSFEECYATTLEVLRTLHKEYIEMGIIKKKE